MATDYKQDVKKVALLSSKLFEIVSYFRSLDTNKQQARRKKQVQEVKRQTAKRIASDEKIIKKTATVNKAKKK